MNLITIVLVLYNWVAVSVLIAFMFAIARFYEKKSGKCSFYQIFPVSAILFVVAAVRYSFLTPPAITGDFLGDSIRFTGGLILGLFSMVLLNLMLKGRS